MIDANATQCVITLESGNLEINIMHSTICRAWCKEFSLLLISVCFDSRAKVLGRRPTLQTAMEGTCRFLCTPGPHKEKEYLLFHGSLGYQSASEIISMFLAALIQILPSKCIEGVQHHADMGPE